MVLKKSSSLRNEKNFGHAAVTSRVRTRIYRRFKKPKNVRSRITTRNEQPVFRGGSNNNVNHGNIGYSVERRRRSFISPDDSCRSGYLRRPFDRLHSSFCVIPYIITLSPHGCQRPSGYVLTNSCCARYGTSVLCPPCHVVFVKYETGFPVMFFA